LVVGSSDERFWKKSREFSDPVVDVVSTTTFDEVVRFSTFATFLGWIGFPSPVEQDTPCEL